MGIAKKIVLGLIAVSITTYGTSAFFIFVLHDLIASSISKVTFTLFTFAAGIFWTALLGYLAARWYIRPLLQLSDASSQAAIGNLTMTVAESRSRDELGTLVRAFRTMIANLQAMIKEISNNAN